jgi:hypothetical protein
VVGRHRVDDRRRDLGRELRHVVEAARVLLACGDGAGVRPLEQRGGDGALDHVARHDDELVAGRLELGQLRAQRILAGALREGDGLVLRHRRRGADEVGLVARDEDDAGALGEVRQRALDDVDLRVPVEAHRVVLAHVALHAAGGVEHEHVDGPQFGDGALEHRGDGCGIREVCSHRDRTAAGRLDLGRDLLGPRRLAAVVDDDRGTGLGEVAGRVGPDAARRSRDEGDTAGERSGGEGVGHVGLLCGAVVRGDERASGTRRTETINSPVGTPALIVSDAGRPKEANWMC